MSTCLDYGIDYPHNHIHCPACHAEWLETRTVTALEEANALKRQELALRESVDWVEAKSKPRPTYVLPPAQQQNEKGGIGIEPRQRKSL